MSVSFSGGDKLAEKLAEISRGIGNGGTVRIGFLEGSTYPDGTSVPMVAALNEYGDPGNNQPPRPYFRRMIALNKPSWGEEVGKVAIAANYDLNLTLQRMGLRIKDQLQKSIRDLVDPPLAPYTIKKKGFDKPLVETAVMLNAVDYDIKDEV